ncbi:hypothetical protein C3941_07350 [Kaistia algarum]|uniref:hypothetical protein n=1 Tax=Kaistia algarum TaxID=2083279 RepID=UPI000CE92AA2|nr:hypothetical protein [Kaistia algarum]MCX5515508.1 hypothetical protein [Kaistia algarum]PPE81088.1 hypothetical protein C3941_07350 [Kaistia algarum]
MGLPKEKSQETPTMRSDQRQTAEYVGRMASELRLISAKADLGFLAYLLGMVEEEASRQSAASQDR